MKGAFSDLMSGDVIIAHYNDKHWHTALMVGDNAIIHATAPGKPIVRQTLDDYRAEFREATKIDEEAEKGRIHGWRFGGAIPKIRSGEGWVQIAEKWCDGAAKGTLYAPSDKTPEAPRSRGVREGRDGPSRRLAAVRAGRAAAHAEMDAQVPDQREVFQGTGHHLLRLRHGLHPDRLRARPVPQLGDRQEEPARLHERAEGAPRRQGAAERRSEGLHREPVAPRRLEPL